LYFWAVVGGAIPEMKNFTPKYKIANLTEFRKEVIDHYKKWRNSNCF